MEFLGLAVTDFVLIDCEQTPVEAADSKNLGRAAKLGGVTPLARIPDAQRHIVLKTLDSGPYGKQGQWVETAEPARYAIENGEYPPLGCRGLAHAALPTTSRANLLPNMLPNPTPKHWLRSGSTR